MKGCSGTALRKGTASIVKYVRLPLHRMTRSLGGKLMAPKNPKDKEQIGRVGEAVCFSSLIEPCRGNGRAFRDGIRRRVRATGPDQVEQNQSQEVA